MPLGPFMLMCLDLFSIVIFSGISTSTEVSNYFIVFKYILYFYKFIFKSFISKLPTFYFFTLLTLPSIIISTQSHQNSHQNTHFSLFFSFSLHILPFSLFLFSISLFYLLPSIICCFINKVAFRFFSYGVRSVLVTSILAYFSTNNPKPIILLTANRSSFSLIFYKIK